MVSLGLMVVGTFLMLWSPWLDSWAAASQVLIRLVPLSRGIFEDYVANFWCISNVIFKWKLRLSQQVGPANNCIFIVHAHIQLLLDIMRARCTLPV